MPRSQGSAESKILQYFRTADLAVAALVLGLAKESVKERQDKIAAAKAAGLKGAAKAKRVAAQKAEAQPAASAAPKKKKSHKKKKAQTAAAGGADQAHMDDFEK